VIFRVVGVSRNKTARPSQERPERAAEFEYVVKEKLVLEASRTARLKVADPVDQACCPSCHA